MRNEYLELVRPHLNHLSESSFRLRREYVFKYAWAIPNEPALVALAALSPLCEIGAGNGYWAALLRARGATIYPYDNGSWTEHRNPWTEVRAGTAAAILEHQDCTLFLCWPPYADPLATDALTLYTGHTVAYIGEGSWGCTANDEFHECLGKQWTLKTSVQIPQWYGIHDRLEIWIRNPL